jgi:spermidine synthase
LVYEIVWLRLAMGAFGVTAPFVAMFLSVFMAGLGLGSWGAGLLSRRLRSQAASGALRFYALAEALLAVSALAVPALLARSQQLLSSTGAALAWDSSAYYWASGLCTAGALLPWCVCMGATFPLAMSAIKKRFAAQSRSSFSYLYLANVLGAASGAALSAYVLIELFGLRGTLSSAAGLNVLIAVLALSLSGERAMSAGDGEPAGGAAAIAAAASSSKNVLPLLFTTGAVSMAMEIVWLRQFTPYVGPSIYTFAAILTLYLGASFVGSCIYRARLRGGGAPSEVAWILSGVLSLLPLCAADPYMPMPGWGRIAVGIIPFCMTMGFLTPSLVDRRSAGDPERAGTAYAVNVLGCILGPLLAGFVLLPRMSERCALVALAMPLFAAGLMAALGRRRGDAPGWGRLNPVAVYAVLVGIGAGAASFSSSFEDRWAAEESGHLETRRDYQADVIACGSGLDQNLLVNGIGMTQVTSITKMMAHLPLALLTRPPRNALVICFGMGTTFRSLLSWGIPTTAVELVPSVPRLFGYFHADADRLLESPSARVVIDDGRRFLARSSDTFDVITIDPPPPMESAGTGLLYTTEFYALVKARLSADGIMQQWILEPLEPAVLSAAVKAITESFPHVRVFRSGEGWGFHCLASREPFSAAAAEALAARMPAPARQDLLEYMPRVAAARQLQAVLRREVAAEDLVAPGARPLRDDRPINEYYFLRRRFPALGRRL